MDKEKILYIIIVLLIAGYLFIYKYPEKIGFLPAKQEAALSKTETKKETVIVEEAQGLESEPYQYSQEEIKRILYVEKHGIRSALGPKYIPD